MILDNLLICVFSDVTAGLLRVEPVVGSMMKFR
jgi:hypothetical protein